MERVTSLHAHTHHNLCTLNLTARENININMIVVNQNQCLTCSIYVQWRTPTTTTPFLEKISVAVAASPFYC